MSNNHSQHHRSRHIIRKLRSRIDTHRTAGEKTADFLTSKLGSMTFLGINMVVFGMWILINVGAVPGMQPFDPYPFHFLTFTVSLEAIFLATVVLISQNRAAKVEDLREEVDLQIDIIAEQEITKALQLLTELLRRQNIAIPNEAELKEMLLPLDTKKIESVLIEDVRREVQ